MFCKTNTYYIFIHSSVVGNLSYFHVFTIVNCAAMVIRVHVYFQNMIFFCYIARSGIAESKDSSIFIFFKEPPYYCPQQVYQFIFPSKCRRVPFYLHSLQHLLFIDFLIMAILTSVKRQLTVVLICISGVLRFMGSQRVGHD